VASEKLQKVLARAGYGSRRACEGFLLEGRVTLNGRRAILGDRADPARDDIRVDGQRVSAAQPRTYVAINKPAGVVSSLAPQGNRPTVRDLVPMPGRLFPVGRLDLESEGLMLLTDDGELANRLTHPRFGCEKEYRVLVSQRPDREQLETWRRGTVLESGIRSLPARVEVEASVGRAAWLRVVMREGRKREIREVGGRLGLHVLRIVRIRIAGLRLGRLRPGQWRRLSKSELQALFSEETPDRGPRESTRGIRNRRRAS
jgi:23S rRNA pseudouridine2605 synthase